MDGEYEIKPFPELYHVRTSVLTYAESKGIAWVLANKYYRKYQPCLVCTLYYILNNVAYIKPEAAIVDDRTGVILSANFGSFEIFYDKKVGGYDYRITSREEVSEKYGSDFVKWIGIVGSKGEDAVCRHLMTAIVDYEVGRANLTKDGINALFTIAAIIIDSIRKSKVVMTEEEEEGAAEVVRKGVERRVKKIAVSKEMPEIATIANLIGYVADRYNLSVDEVLEKVRSFFRR